MVANTRMLSPPALSLFYLTNYYTKFRHRPQGRFRTGQQKFPAYEAGNYLQLNQIPNSFHRSLYRDRILGGRFS